MNTSTSRAPVERAVQDMFVLDVLAIVYFTILLALICIGIWEKRRTFDIWKNPGHRSCVWLLCILAFQIAFFGVELSMHHKDYQAPELLFSCQAQAKFLPTAWVISKQFVYFFLYERAIVVHNSMLQMSRWFIRFRQAVGFFIVVGVAAVFYWASLTLFDGVVFVPEGICVMVTDSRFIMYLFAASDVILSACLLFLFFYPLWKHLQAMKRAGFVQAGDTSTSTEFQVQLRGLLNKNTVWSSLTVLSALAAMITLAILIPMANDNTDGEVKEHLFIYALFGPSIDTLLCVTFIMQISNVWRPSFLKCSSKSTSSNENNNNTGSKIGGSALKSNQIHNNTALNNSVAVVATTTEEIK